MKKHLYEIKRLDIPAYLKWWFIKIKNNLPKEYQEVLYIENSEGTEYINTEVLPKLSNKIIIEGKLIEILSGGNYAQIFGALQSSNGITINVSFTRNGSSRFDGKVSQTGALMVNSNEKFKIETSKENLKLNNEIVNTFNATQEININREMFIFRANGSTNIGKFRIYNCKVYDDNKIIRNFIPCYRKEDNEIGFYETVSKSFYVNEGEGNFTYGIDEETEDNQDEETEDNQNESLLFQDKAIPKLLNLKNNYENEE